MRKINIKNSWKDLTLKDVLELNRIHSEANSDNEVEMYIKILSVLSDFTEEQLNDMDVSFISSLQCHLSFLSEDIEKKLPESSYMINGVKYKVNTDIGSLKAGQWIDIVNWSKIQNNEDELHSFLALIMSPEGSKYNIDVYNNSKEEILNNFSIVEAKAISDFFLLTYESIIEGIRNYLVKTMKKGSKGLSKQKQKEMMNMIKELKGLTHQNGTL